MTVSIIWLSERLVVAERLALSNLNMPLTMTSKIAKYGHIVDPLRSCKDRFYPCAIQTVLLIGSKGAFVCIESRLNVLKDIAVCWAVCEYLISFLAVP